MPQYFFAAGGIGNVRREPLQQRAVILPGRCTQERPVRSPQAVIRAKRLQQRGDEGLRVGKRKIFFGEFREAGNFYVGARVCRHLQQRGKTGCVEAPGHVGSAAMVDHHLHTSTLQHRHEGAQLVVLHLHVGKHLQRRQALQQRPDVGVMGAAIQRHVECNADNALRFEICQLRQWRIVGHNSDAFEAPTAIGNCIQQAAVVGAIPRVGFDQQGMVRVVGVQHLREIVSRAGFLPRRAIGHLVAIGKTSGVEDVAVAVDFRQAVD